MRLGRQKPNRVPTYQFVTLAGSEWRARSLDPDSPVGERDGWIVHDDGYVEYRVDVDLVEDPALRATRSFLDEYIAGGDPGGRVAALSEDRLREWNVVLTAGDLGTKKRRDGFRSASGFFVTTSLVMTFEGGETESIDVVREPDWFPYPDDGPGPEALAWQKPAPVIHCFQFSSRFYRHYRSDYEMAYQRAINLLNRARNAILDDIKARLAEELRHRLTPRMASPEVGYPEIGMRFEEIDPALRKGFFNALQGEKIEYLRPVLSVCIEQDGVRQGFDALFYIR